MSAIVEWAAMQYSHSFSKLVASNTICRSPGLSELESKAAETPM